jgi:hypothetical protein
MIADSTQHSGEGDRLANEVKRLLMATFGDQSHVALNMDATRTGGFAGCHAPLFDRKDVWHSSLIWAKNGLPIGAANRHRHWADLNAILASRAFIKVNEPWGVLDVDLEPTLSTMDARDLCSRHQGNVGMFDCLEATDVLKRGIAITQRIFWNRATQERRRL